MTSTAPHQKKHLAARMGSWSARNKKKAIFGWLAFILLSVFIGGAVGTKQISDSDGGAGDSGRADRVIDKAFPDRAEESILIQSKDASARQSAVRDVEGTVKRFGVELQPRQTSDDGRSVLVGYEMPGDDESTALVDRNEKIENAVAAVGKEHAGDAFVGQFGGISATRAMDKALGDDFKQAELLSLPVTLVILLVAFGAFVAAGLPLLLGLTAVGGTLGLIALPSQIMPVDEAISSVVLLIGLAVGVDYTLFYLRREREERRRGAGRLEAIDVAAATSGRAVLVSGLTVMVAMAGMFLTGQATFQSFAVGTITVVAVAMIGSLTVVPALLAALGDKVEKGRIPFLHRLRRDDGESRLWNAVLDRVLERPLVAASLATAVLVALAIPALGMKTAEVGMTNLPADLAVMTTYERMQDAFPGGEIPAEVVVRGDAIERIPALTAATQSWGEADVSLSPDRSVAVVSIPIPGDGANDASIAAIDELRGDIVPRTVGADALVAGQTAGSKDFNDLMSSKAPIVFAFVLALAFGLLLVTFRSVVIPIKAIVLNLLSVAAAYGVLVLVFQHEVGASLLGVDEANSGFIVSWLPMFLFVILFGLSMDYHVFILSRIREAFDGGMNTEEAVAHGIKTTAGVVTSAAVVMVGVFAIFGTLQFIAMKQMGVGLAAAILIDATIIRGVLLPATMKLLGDWNWWLPKRLEWLPRFDVEGRQPEPVTA
ncbi:MAG: Integral membrane protein [uncultured Solirubrobacteraceae bacterium]|uniref:Integral membrane protein n=1 Tax=uncultured Solirubrobacteraceae bacterium TaxID=1162706 RepID=A0A6J4RMN0_9ACTN|nr:MAG: Integral membrane protein [uncultured Solirubrobacteraceae bacterium]